MSITTKKISELVEKEPQKEDCLLISRNNDSYRVKYGNLSSQLCSVLKQSISLDVQGDSIWNSLSGHTISSIADLNNKDVKVLQNKMITAKVAKDINDRVTQNSEYVTKTGDQEITGQKTFKENTIKCTENAVDGDDVVTLKDIDVYFADNYVVKTAISPTSQQLLSSIEVFSNVQTTDSDTIGITVANSCPIVIYNEKTQYLQIRVNGSNTKIGIFGYNGAGIPSGATQEQAASIIRQAVKDKIYDRFVYYYGDQGVGSSFSTILPFAAKQYICIFASTMVSNQTIQSMRWKETTDKSVYKKYVTNNNLEITGTITSEGEAKGGFKKDDNPLPNQDAENWKGTTLVQNNGFRVYKETKTSKGEAKYSIYKYWYLQSVTSKQPFIRPSTNKFGNQDLISVYKYA